MNFNAIKPTVLASIIFFSALANAAVIQGTAYDWTTFEPLQKVLIEVNTTPAQKVLSKDGNYVLEVPRGNYVIKAVFQSGNKSLAAREELAVNSDGEFIVDLFLGPEELIEDGIIIDPPGDETDFPVDEEPDYSFVYAIIAVVIAVALTAFYFNTRQKKREQQQLATKETEKKQHELQEEKHVQEKPSGRELELSPEAREVLKKIRESDGRLNQRDLRSQLPYSEAKTSLVVSELQASGLVKKIKLGRGNILIINDK